MVPVVCRRLTMRPPDAIGLTGFNLIWNMDSLFLALCLKDSPRIDFSAAGALEPRAALEEAMGHAGRSESTRRENEIRPKEEDLNDSSMLQAMQQAAITMDVQPKQQDETPGPSTENVMQSGESTQPDRHQA
jgi:hypothetical protein